LDIWQFWIFQSVEYRLFGRKNCFQKKSIKSVDTYIIYFYNRKQWTGSDISKIKIHLQLNKHFMQVSMYRFVFFIYYFHFEYFVRETFLQGRWTWQTSTDTVIDTCMKCLFSCKCILIFEIYSVKVLIYFNVILTWKFYAQNSKP
jgi:hypothetical protein